MPLLSLKKYSIFILSQVASKIFNFIGRSNCLAFQELVFPFFYLRKIPLHLRQLIFPATLQLSLDIAWFCWHTWILDFALIRLLMLDLLFEMSSITFFFSQERYFVALTVFGRRYLIVQSICLLLLMVPRWFSW